jgi:hypothetical protein
MTVKELIIKLQALNPNFTVLVGQRDSDKAYEACIIRVTDFGYNSDSTVEILH